MYINFHAHSEYSKKDAISRVMDIAEANKRFGNDAFAITDHGDLGCWIQAYKAAEKTGLQFIPGCEFYVIPEDPEMYIWNAKNNDEVDVSEFATRYFHLVVIAKNQKGVKNLIAIYNSHIERYGKPCVTKEAIYNNSDGLIVSTACVSGEILYYIRKGLDDLAEKRLIEFKEHFGDDFYVELQYHHLESIDEIDIYSKLVSLAKKHNIKMIPTTDSHFTYKEDALDHQIYKNLFDNFRDKDRYGVVCNYDIDKDEFKQAFEGNGYYIKNEAEIIESISNIPNLTEEDIRECVANTVEIRNKCEETHFPKAKPFLNMNKQLRKVVESGFDKKRVGTDLEEASKERYEYELSVIENMGFSEYFINVNDIIKRCVALNILHGPARGCFIPGSEVITSNGVKAIEDIKKDDLVLTLSGEFKSVIGLLEYDVDEECIELELSNGKTIKCTKDHKIFCDGKWIEAEKLSVGDKLFSPDAEKLN